LIPVGATPCGRPGLSVFSCLPEMKGLPYFGQPHGAAPTRLTDRAVRFQLSNALPGIGVALRPINKNLQINYKKNVVFSFKT
ncbi:MAG: hypothetical protein PUF31_08540, partial [Oscillospiraceae bacterium]|nr:hypothetical protein [Oscillospiraceae bacterium]